jgi:hypothetical protein
MGHAFKTVQLLLYAIPHFTDFWLFGIVSGDVRNTHLPFSRAKYRSYEPCFMSTPLPAAHVLPGRILVSEVRVELPCDGTFVFKTLGTARSLIWFQFTPYSDFVGFIFGET